MKDMIKWEVMLVSAGLLSAAIVYGPDLRTALVLKDYEIVQQQALNWVKTQLSTNKGTKMYDCREIYPSTLGKRL